jgi:hypothetical protein
LDWCTVVRGVVVYRPCLDSTCFAAFSTLSSESTSITTSSTLPGKPLSFKAATAASPLAAERLPSRTMALGDSRSRAQRAKPMPQFAPVMRVMVLSAVEDMMMGLNLECEWMILKWIVWCLLL